jgi:hypothetical protein
MSRRPATLATLAIAAVLAAGNAHAVQRTFVASTGSDANTATNCGFANPCRSFAAAMTVTDSKGEVVALDAAGFGAVTITKSITLTANPGFFAGIAASSGNAVTIATPSIDVTLRGLAINGVGATTGIHMSNGATLTVERSIVSNFAGSAMQILNAAEVRIIDSTIRDSYNGISLTGGARATIAGSRFYGNYAGTGGVVVEAAAAATTTATITDSVASGNWIGFYVCASTGGTARLAVSRSTVSSNAYGIVAEGCAGTTIGILSSNVVSGNSNGLYQSGAATLKSLGNNTVDLNLTNITGTVSAASGI